MTSDEEFRRPFADWLREMSGGRTHDDLSEALAEVAAAVQETGKKGSLSLTVTIAPLKNGGGALTIADVVKKSVPQHDRRTSIYYVDRTGNLTRDDPMQPTFDALREVPPAEVRTIDPKEKRA